MSENTELEVCQMLEDTFREKRDDQLAQYVDWIKQCLQFPDLLTVFTLDSNNSAKDIDLAILKALLKGKPILLACVLHCFKFLCSLLFLAYRGKP